MWARIVDERNSRSKLTSRRQIMAFRKQTERFCIFLNCFALNNCPLIESDILMCVDGDAREITRVCLRIRECVRNLTCSKGTPLQVLQDAFPFWWSIKIYVTCSLIHLQYLISRSLNYWSNSCVLEV